MFKYHNCILAPFISNFRKVSTVFIKFLIYLNSASNILFSHTYLGKCWKFTFTRIIVMNAY
jgi:hypothetical protein